MTQQHSEAPISFNVKAYAPSGYDCMLTIRGEDSAELMDRALKALDWLQAQGFAPTRNGHAPEATAPSSNGKTPQAAPAGTAPICPTHGQPMRESKHGGWYCPQLVADDDGTGKPVYCRQRVKA